MTTTHRARRRVRRRLVATALVTAAMPSLLRAGAEPPALNVGLVPFVSTRAMLANYEPLRRHLESALGRRVAFHTATGFAALVDNARDPSQPLTLMPMHLARLAIEDWGFRLVVRSSRESEVAIWLPARTAVDGARGLGGLRLALLDELSIASMLCRRWLETEGLAPAVPVTHHRTQSAALAALVRGDVDAVCGARGQLQDAPEFAKADLRPAFAIGRVLTPAFVAHPALPEPELQALRAALLDWRPATASGASGAEFVAGDERDFAPYAPFVAEARARLATRRGGPAQAPR
jgi:phosphonate transport system substrate-binding protein